MYKPTSKAAKIPNLNLHNKGIRKRGTNKTKLSIKTKIKIINKTKSWFFEKVNKIDKQDSSRKNKEGEHKQNPK